MSGMIKLGAALESVGLRGSVCADEGTVWLKLNYGWTVSNKGIEIRGCGKGVIVSAKIKSNRKLLKAVGVDHTVLFNILSAKQNGEAWTPLVLSYSVYPNSSESGYAVAFGSINLSDDANALNIDTDKVYDTKAAAFAEAHRAGGAKVVVVNDGASGLSDALKDAVNNVGKSFNGFNVGGTIKAAMMPRNRGRVELRRDGKSRLRTLEDKPEYYAAASLAEDSSPIAVKYVDGDVYIGSKAAIDDIATNESKSAKAVDLINRLGGYEAAKQIKVPFDATHYCISRKSMVKVFSNAAIDAATLAHTSALGFKETTLENDELVTQDQIDSAIIAYKHKYNTRDSIDKDDIAVKYVDGAAVEAQMRQLKPVGYGTPAQAFIVAGDEHYTAPSVQAVEQSSENAHKELPPDATIAVPYDLVMCAIKELTAGGCHKLGKALMALVGIAEENAEKRGTDWQALSVDFPLNGRIVEFNACLGAKVWRAAVQDGVTQLSTGNNVHLAELLRMYPETQWRYYNGDAKNVTKAKKQQDGD